MDNYFCVEPQGQHVETCAGLESSSVTCVIPDRMGRGPRWVKSRQNAAFV